MSTSRRLQSYRVYSSMLYKVERSHGVEHKYNLASEQYPGVLFDDLLCKLTLWL